MKIVTFESLGLNVNLNVPADVAEYNALAPARENAVLQDAISNVVYRSSLASFRKEFVLALSKETNIPRQTKEVPAGKPDAAGVQKTKLVPDETEKDYVDRVIASLALAEAKTEDEIRARFQPLADSIAAKLKFDPSEDVSEGVAKKPTKESIALVAQLKKDGKFDTARTKLAEQYNITPVPETDDEVALLIAEHLRKTREAAAVAARSTLAGL